MFQKKTFQRYRPKIPKAYKRIFTLHVENLFAATQPLAKNTMTSIRALNTEENAERRDLFDFLKSSFQHREKHREIAWANCPVKLNEQMKPTELFADLEDDKTVENIIFCRFLQKFNSIESIRRFPKLLVLLNSHELHRNRHPAYVYGLDFNQIKRFAL